MNGPLAWFAAKFASSYAMWGGHGSLRAACQHQGGRLGRLTRADPDCLGCRPVPCCRQLYVPLSAAEAASGRYRLALKARGGHPILARRPDGACVYLQQERCSIHARRPQACRDYDCRQDPRASVVWPSC